MKTIILKSGGWFLPVTVFFVLIILLKLNLVNRMDDFISRQDFEAFLNDKIKEFFQDKVESPSENSSIQMADAPDQAALQDYLNTVDPVLKRVPRERLKDAYKYTSQLREDDLFKAEAGLQWQGTTANFGGRTRAVMWDPNDSDHHKVWAGGVTGGLWYNDDITDNSTWIPVNDFWPGLSISCITYDPNQTETFYAGTGEAQTALIIYRESSGHGFGIQRSVDGGENWDVMPGTETFEFITDIEVRNEDGVSVLYAAVASGIYKGIPHISDPSDGLFRSVVGSNDWEQVLPLIDGLEVPFAPADIEIGAGGRIFVGTMPNVDGDGAASILYSDSGLPDSWTVNDDYRILIEDTPQMNLPGRVILASAPSDPDRVYGLIAQGWFNGIPAYQCHLIVRSSDNGESWETVSIPPDNSATGNWAFIAWHALTAAVDPNDADRIYVGALDMYVSPDGGDSWTKKSNWGNTAAYNYVHADQHRILYQPGSSDEMLVVSDGGVFYTTEASQSSTPFAEVNEGYNTLQMYKIALHPEAGNTFFLGGMQDNGTIYYDGNPIDHQNSISGGDGGACFIDKDESGIMITSYQNNRFFIYENGQYTGSATNWASGNFISSVAYDFKNNTLYANAVTVVNQLQDNVLRISGIPSPPYSGEFLNMGTGSTVPFTHVMYSEYSPEESATLYLGTQSGRLFRVENAESTPAVSEIGTEAFPPAAISSIALGGSEDTILVTFSNYGVSSVWQTYAGGDEWAEREGNLPDMPVRWAVYHPQCAKAAMLATEIGIWTSYQLDMEEPTWQPDNEGLANVRIDMLQIRENDNTVLAGTHGRGFYHTTFDYNPTTGTEEWVQNTINIYPNPTRGFTTINLPSAYKDRTEVELIDMHGEIIKSGWRLPANGESLNIDVSNLSNGIYFIRIDDGSSRSMTKKLIKM